MTNVQKYLVAKYVPDIRRMEPVNIGIVLWSNGQTAHRFLDPQDAISIQDKKTYQRWIDYWTGLLDKPEITVPRSRPTPKTEPEFLDAFAKTQKGNYLLMGGGEVIDKIPKKQINRAASYLFDQLVGQKNHWPTEKKAQGAQLKLASDRLFSDIGARDLDEFKSRHPVQCKVGGSTKTVPVDYAVENGSLKSAFQRVNLAQISSVGYATFLFEHALKKLDKNHRVAVVRTGGDSEIDDEMESSIGLLRETATVVDLSDYQAAAKSIREIIHGLSA